MELFLFGLKLSTYLFKEFIVNVGFLTFENEVFSGFGLG